MVRLMVGLANPGSEYEKTRHNAGAWLLERLVAAAGQTFRPDNKLKGLFANVSLGGKPCFLLIPTTYMNHSGQSVLAAAQYYKIPPEEILIVHDELDLPVGTVRLKKAGGHGGHNGLRDIISHLSSKDFLRLRVGIGRPRTGQPVVDYVLSRPGRAEREQVDSAIDESIAILDNVIDGNLQKAMQALHTDTP